MTPSRLNLDFRKRESVSAAGIAVLAAGAGLLGGVAFLHQHADADLRRMESRLADISPVPRAGATAEPAPTATTAHMRAVLARLQLPWEQFFTVLESIATNDVTLLAISPNSTRGTLHLRGEAKDLYAALRYVKALGHGGYFHDVELLEHEIGTQNPFLPVRFVVAARWGSIGAPE